MNGQLSSCPLFAYAEKCKKALFSFQSEQCVQLKNVGFEKLEEALEKASLSNSREMVSVNFYRRFLSE